MNVERQVDSIDEKLQLFIEMYQEDRKKIFEYHERLHEEVKPDTPYQIMDVVKETLDNGNDVQTEAMFGVLSDLHRQELLSDKQEVHTPESEMTLPTNTPSRSSTYTSISQGLEILTIGDSKQNAVYSAYNAYNVWYPPNQVV